jgi:hypothetical protein
MATTTGGTTYVTSTDLVADYPTASLALANRVDVVASGGPGLVKTAGYTITVADILGGNKFLYNSASPGTFTLPTSSLVDGMVVNVAQIGTGALTVSGGTIVGTTVTTAQYQGLSFVYVASGTTWYSIAPNATAPGLAIVAPTTISAGGGSSSLSGGAVTFTGVSSISLNGCFTTTYDNYEILLQITASSAAGYTGMRMRVGGTDSTAASYSTQSLEASATSVSASRLASQTSMNVAYHDTSYPGIFAQMVVNAPALARNTNLTSVLPYREVAATQIAWRTMAGVHAVATAYDGFTLLPTSGTITGVVTVYGYRNS